MTLARYQPPLDLDAQGRDHTDPLQVQQLLGGLLETMTEGVVVLDDEGVVVYSNPAAATIFGVAPDHLKHTGYHSQGLEVYHPDGSQMPREETASWQAMASQRAVHDVELGIRRPDGKVYWLRTSASPLLDASGILAGAVVVFTDLTEQVLCEQARQRSEERFQTVFRAGPIPTYLFRWDGQDLRLETCNEAAVDHTEGRVTDFIGHSARELQPIQPRLLEVLERCYRERVSLAEEIVYRFRNGEEHFYDSRFTFVPPDLVLAYAHDVTERRRVHYAARQSREALTRAHSLLLALSQAAQAVQEAASPEAVFRTIGNELERLGYHVVVLTLAPDRQNMTVTHVSIQSRLLRAAEKLADVRTSQATIPLAPGGFFSATLAHGESVFCPRTAELVGRGLPKLGRSLIERLIGMLGMEQTVFAPMLDDDVTHLLAIAGDDLSEADIPAVSAFAGQSAIALRNARLYQQQRELAQQLVSVQEEERRRLASTLHDQAGQSLTAMRLRLELIAEDLPEELGTLRERLAETARGTRTLMDQLRRVTHDLHPPELDAVGLEPALSGLCQSLSDRSRLAITFEAKELPPLSDAASVTLYRFLQEALTNVAKHAGASRVFVKLGTDAEMVSLSVEDDGHGVDLEVLRRQPGAATGLGITAIRERLEGLGGRLQLESQQGKGTCLIAQIPLRAR